MGHYEVLGVAADASPAEVRRAYLALARQHHPDAGGLGESMTAVNEAWAVLSDPARRRRYDLEQAGAWPGGGPSGGDAGGRDWVGADDGGRTDADRFGSFDADLLDDHPVRPVRPGGRLPVAAAMPLVPPGLFAASVAVGCVGLAVDAPVVLGAAAVLFLLSCVAVAAVALFALRGGTGRR